MIHLKFQLFNLCVFSVQYHVKNTWFFIKTAFVYVYVYMKYFPCYLRFVESQWNFWPAAFDYWRVSYQNCSLSTLIHKADNSNLQVYLFTDYLDISRVFYIQWIWLYLLDIHSLFLYFKENCCRQNTIMSQFFCLTSKMC